MKAAQSTNSKGFFATLTKSLSDTLQVQASTLVKVDKVEAVKPSMIAGVEVLASVGMKSSKHQGMLAIYFPKATFLGVLNRMLGEKFTEITDENADAAGELANILYAQARVAINLAGEDFHPAIPTVVKGEKVVLLHSGAGAVMRASCVCEFGPLYLECSMRKC